MERFDLFDKNRLPLNKTLERGDKLPKNTYKQGASCIIFNSLGDKILIQKRVASKKHWASLWDFSSGGASKAGETSVETITRETFEELGVNIDFSNIRPALTVNFEHYFHDFYLVKKDIEITSLHLQESEVEDVKWATKNEIENLIENNQFVPFYKSFLSLIFDMQDKEGVHSS